MKLFLTLLVVTVVGVAGWAVFIGTYLSDAAGVEKNVAGAAVVKPVVLEKPEAHGRPIAGLGSLRTDGARLAAEPRRDAAAAEEIAAALPRPAAKPAPAPISTPALTKIVPFETSAFPYDGIVPDDGLPFIALAPDGRRSHASKRGGTYFEDVTYSSRDVLLSFPANFDLKRGLIVVFFHGNNVRLDRDVRGRQRVPRQFLDAGINAVLVAPQLAWDALDSSAGHFWEEGTFSRFLDEAAEKLAIAYGRPESERAFAELPVVIVAYSGGYEAAAYSLFRGGVNGRVRGVILLDALYNHMDKFANWIDANRADKFFVSAYSKSSRVEHTELQKLLAERRVAVDTKLATSLRPGTVSIFFAGDSVVHNDFMTKAWIDNPLRLLLSRIEGFSSTSKK